MSMRSQPRLIKGALVDANQQAYPPLTVPFQFNPDKLTRHRAVRVSTPRSRLGREESTPEAESMGDAQMTLTNPETISLDIRLDATDALAAGDPAAGEFGVLPALATLEMMITPRPDTVLGGAPGSSASFGSGSRLSTPVLIFVWGRQRRYLVRLTDMDIQEVEFNPNLNPTRVIAGVSMQVLGGATSVNRLTEMQPQPLGRKNPITAPDLARSVINLRWR
jgi:hypothetical protein